MEFGDSDAVKDEYSSRSEAGNLLLLLFEIGLASFYQGSARSTDNKSSEARSLVRLFKELNSATCEMREIDSTLNHEKWLLIVQHLAIRSLNQRHQRKYSIDDAQLRTLENLLR